MFERVALARSSWNRMPTRLPFKVVACLPLSVIHATYSTSESVPGPWVTLITRLLACSISDRTHIAKGDDRVSHLASGQTCQVANLSGMEMNESALTHKPDCLASYRRVPVTVGRLQKHVDCHAARLDCLAIYQDKVFDGHYDHKSAHAARR